MMRLRSLEVRLLKIFQRNLEIQADIRYHIVSNNIENNLLVNVYTTFKKGLI